MITVCPDTERTSVELEILLKLVETSAHSVREQRGLPGSPLSLDRPGLRSARARFEPPRLAHISSSTWLEILYVSSSTWPQIFYVACDASTPKMGLIGEVSICLARIELTFEEGSSLVPAAGAEGARQVCGCFQATARLVDVVEGAMHHASERHRWSQMPSPFG